MLAPTDDVTTEEHGKSCMEVWGGNRTANDHFTRPGLDIWLRSQSPGVAEAGGGDLHLLSSCASGRITRMLLADVCGFGSLFTEIAGELRELMKRNVNSIQQARVVRQMSRQLGDASQRGGFASTLVSTYFAPTRSFTLCNAGHPPPLLFRCQTREWSILKQQPTETSSSGQRLGVVDPDEYQQFKTTLEIGDMVLSYSNAFTEGRNSEGRTIGLDGILDRVRRMDADTPAHFPQMLLEQVRGEHPDNLANEDATLLLCQATETPVAWRDNLFAPFRLLRSVSDKTKIG